jgi:transmembrane sensor
MSDVAPIPGSEEAIAAEAARWIVRRDAGLGVVEQRELEAWLAEDERHAAAMEYYARAWSVIDRPWGAGATDRVLAQVRARRRRRRLRRLGGGAIVAAVLAALLFQGEATLPAPSGSERRSGVALLQAERRTLDDGTVVELKSGSDVAAAYTPERRQVELRRGEAHFQVVKDPARPFIVSVRGVEIRAVGTAFAVQLNPGAVEVLVTEGRVAVAQTPPTSATTGEAERLAEFGAGNRLVVDLVPAIGTPPPAVQSLAPREIVERLAWRSPRIEFTDTPLEEAIALMNQAGSPATGAGVRLSIDPGSPELASEPVSGLFRADSAEAFVHVLELSLNLRSERRGDVILLRKGD